jgi:hypothetical protein
VGREGKVGRCVVRFWRGAGRRGVHWLRVRTRTGGSKVSGLNGVKLEGRGEGERGG